MALQWQDQEIPNISVWRWTAKLGCPTEWLIKIQALTVASGVEGDDHSAMTMLNNKTASHSNLRTSDAGPATYVWGSNFPTDVLETILKSPPLQLLWPNQQDLHIPRNHPWERCRIFLFYWAIRCIYPKIFMLYWSEFCQLSITVLKHTENLKHCYKEHHVHFDDFLQFPCTIPALLPV